MTTMTGLFRLGRDAETRYTQGGDAVCSLSLAYNYGRKGDDGNRPTQWVDATLWGKRAEALAQYLTKGSLIFAVLSEVRIETYARKDGGEGHKLAARVDDIEFTGRANDAPSERAERPERPSQPRPAPARAQPTRTPEAAFEDDDIPF